MQYIIAFIVFSYLVRREKNSISGSPAMMGIVTLLVGIPGYLFTGHLVIETFHVRSMWVANLALIVWLALGYGAYRLIHARREKAFYDKLEE